MECPAGGAQARGRAGNHFTVAGAPYVALMLRRDALRAVASFSRTPACLDSRFPAQNANRGMEMTSPPGGGQAGPPPRAAAARLEPDGGRRGAAALRRAAEERQDQAAQARALQQRPDRRRRTQGAMRLEFSAARCLETSALPMGDLLDQAPWKCCSYLHAAADGGGVLYGPPLSNVAK